MENIFGISTWMKMMFKLTHMLGNKICDCELGSSADYVSSSVISLMKYQALTIFCQFMRRYIYLFIPLFYDI